MITNHLLGAAAVLAFILLKFIHCFHDTNQTPGMKYTIENGRLLSKINEYNEFLDSFYSKVIKEK